jgi:hypothetical protein
LTADRLVEDLFAASTTLPSSDAIFSAAHKRLLLGNPPGKDRSTLGDQLNWESLLHECPPGHDLHLVSKDGDYGSELGERAHQFLIDEWRAKKNSELFLHNELTTFLSTSFPDIKFAIDVEKKVLIDSLISSGSFASTHIAIEKLASLSNLLTIDDAKKLIAGAIENFQISYIGTDSDVTDFYRPLIEQFGAQLDKATLAAIAEVLVPPSTWPEPLDEPDELPDLDNETPDEVPEPDDETLEEFPEPGELPQQSDESSDPVNKWVRPRARPSRQ